MPSDRRAIISDRKYLPPHCGAHSPIARNPLRPSVRCFPQTQFPVKLSQEMNARIGTLEGRSIQRTSARSAFYLAIALALLGFGATIIAARDWWKASRVCSEHCGVPNRGRSIEIYSTGSPGRGCTAVHVTKRSISKHSIAKYCIFLQGALKQIEADCRSLQRLERNRCSYSATLNGSDRS